MTMRDNLEHYLEAFPDFDRLDAPVFKAIYTARFNQWADRMDTLEEMRKALSIDNAYGYTLDLLGQGYNVLRPPGMEDGPFRDLIKMELLANRSGGDLETINAIGRYIFGDNYSGSKEAWVDDYPKDVAGIKVRIKAGDKQNPRLIQRAKPGGVKMFYNYYGPTANPILWVGSHSYLGMTTTVYPEVVDFTELNKVKERIENMDLSVYTDSSVAFL